MPPTNIKKIGKYDVLELIGRGGMGVVYKATDPSLDRLVAIKMIGGAFADDPDLLKRFYREAQSTASLRHPNIVTVYDMGEHNGYPYIVMEFLEGESLQEVVSQRRALPLLQRINYILQVCRGLEYAHGRQIVHRDIKPANVVVLRDSSVKIVDFGIVHMGDLRMTRPGQLVGSMEYMSPEQINDGPIDQRTDIFAVGVLLFQIITYELPFRGQDIPGTLMKIVHEPPPSLSKFLASYPAELETIVERALAKDKEDRYQSVADFAFDLHQVEGELKRHPTKEMLQRSTEFMAREEWTGAREQLLELLKIDPQNPEANDLMRQVQQQIHLRRRSEQARELRVQAEQLVAQEKFAPALQLLQQAIALDDNPDLGRYRDEVKGLSDRCDKIQSALQRANAARAVGDLDRAMQAIHEVLQLQPNHSEGLATQDTLEDEIACRARSRELQQLLENARREISGRRFTDALNTLSRAELLDPNAPNLHQLTQLASEGREQERRRKELQAAVAQIEDALNSNDFDAASACLRDTLPRFPGEPSLLKLKALIERQKQRHERRIWVETRMNAARKYLDEGRPEDALATLEDAAQRYPTEASLQSLLAIVQQSVEQQRAEKRKTEVVALATNAMRRKAFEEALATLEAAQTELETTDFDDLIAFARDEALARARQLKLEAIANQSQTLLESQEYERAIELLEGALQEEKSEELLLLLESARDRLCERQKVVEELVKTLDRLLEQDKAEEAIALLEKEKALVANSPPIAAAWDRAEKKRQWLEELGAQRDKVKQALTHRNFEEAESALNECRSRFGDRPEFVQLDQELARGRSDVHRATVERAMADAAMLAKFGSPEAALQTLERVADSVRYLSPEERAEYGKYAEQLRTAVQRTEEIAYRDAEGRQRELEATAGLEQRRRQEEADLPREKTRQEQARIGAEQDQLQAEEQRGSSFLQVQWINLKAAFSRRRHEADAWPNAERNEPGAQELNPSPGNAVPGVKDQVDDAAIRNSQLPTRNFDEGTPTFNSDSDAAPTSDPWMPNEAPLPLGSLASEKSEIAAPSSLPPNAQRWPDDVLVHIEKQLAAFIGPLAKVIVRRAASKTTNWDELFSSVAESLDTDAERQEFLACKQRLHLSSASPDKPDLAGTAVAEVGPAMRGYGDFTPELIAQTSRLLARYVGPISSVLVRRATQRADSLRAFYLLLADELESAGERTQFLREVGMSDQK
jgi:eukaryotic-like serine/threonine-protein kinase